MAIISSGGQIQNTLQIDAASTAARLTLYNSQGIEIIPDMQTVQPTTTGGIYSAYATTIIGTAPSAGAPLLMAMNRGRFLVILRRIMATMTFTKSALGTPVVAAATSTIGIFRTLAAQPSQNLNSAPSFGNVKKLDTSYNSSFDVEYINTLMTSMTTIIDQFGMPFAIFAAPQSVFGYCPDVVMDNLFDSDFYDGVEMQPGEGFQASYVNAGGSFVVPPSGFSAAFNIEWEERFQ